MRVVQAGRVGRRFLGNPESSVIAPRATRSKQPRVGRSFPGVRPFVGCLDDQGGEVVDVDAQRGRREQQVAEGVLNAGAASMADDPDCLPNRVRVRVPGDGG